MWRRKGWGEVREEMGKDKKKEGNRAGEKGEGGREEEKEPPLPTLPPPRPPPPVLLIPFPTCRAT